MTDHGRRWSSKEARCPGLNPGNAGSSPVHLPVHFFHKAIGMGVLGHPRFLKRKIPIMKNLLTFFLILFPFVGFSQFSVASYVGGIYQDGTTGEKYNFEASVFYQPDRMCYELKYGNVGNESYVSIAVGEYINDRLRFMMSGDYYMRGGMTETGLPRNVGMSSEIKYRIARIDDIDLSISTRWGFNTERVFGMIGVKFSLWQGKRSFWKD